VIAESSATGVIARSVSDEAISKENKDCFAALAMTAALNFPPLAFTVDPFLRVSEADISFSSLRLLTQEKTRRKAA
jgi:hypothetical protein